MIGQKAIPNILKYSYVYGSTAREVREERLGEVCDPRFRPAACPAPAWSVAERLRAWVEIDAAARGSRA